MWVVWMVVIGLFFLVSWVVRVEDSEYLVLWVF